MKTLLMISLAMVCVSGIELGMGTITGKPQNKIRKYAPIAKYLQNHLSEYGVTQVHTRFAPDMESMADRISKKEVHIFVDSIFASTYMMKHVHTKPLLRRWKEGVATYQSVLISKRDSPIRNLDDLVGHTVGFEDSYSSSGFFVPKMDLILKGYAFQFEGEEHPEKIRYVFTGGEDDKSSTYQLIKGHFQAAATNNTFFDQFVDSERFRVLYRSEKIPRHIVSTAHLSAKLEKALKKVLMNMHQNGEGLQALEYFDKTRKFDVLGKRAQALMDAYSDKLELLY